MDFEFSTVADTLLVAGGAGTLVAALATRAPRSGVASRWQWATYGLGGMLFFAGLIILGLVDSPDRPLLRTIAMTLAGFAGVIGTGIVLRTELALIGGDSAAKPRADSMAIGRRVVAVLALIAGDALVVYSLVAVSRETRSAGVAGGLLLILLAAGLLLHPLAPRNKDREVQH